MSLWRHFVFQQQQQQKTTLVFLEMKYTLSLRLYMPTTLFWGGAETHKFRKRLVNIETKCKRNTEKKLIFFASTNEHVPIVIQCKEYGERGTLRL